MKKFLTFLALACFMVAGAWAGNITTLDQVETDAKYTLQCPRGYLTVKADLSKLEGNVVANRSFDIEDGCFHFQFVENGGNYYLYNVGANGYSTNDGTIVSDIASAAPINLRDYGNGTAQPYWDGSHNLNLGGQKQLAIGTWTDPDDGDQFTISKVDDSRILWEKPQFGGTVWTYNTTTKQFDAEGQTSTAKPGRVGGNGSVMLFNGVGTVSTQTGGDTSDKGGVRVLGNGDNVTTTLGSWAGSIEVEKFAVATVEYGSQLKGTEPENSATVWVNGDLTFKNRTDFNMNDGQSQRWYIGENGHISTSFTKVTRNDSRLWKLQIVVADEEPIEGITQTLTTIHRQVMTWGADISSSISSCVAYYKDSEGTLHKLPSTAIKYSASGITVEYEGLGNPVCTMTYDYIYEGETKASVEVEATIGGNYPSPSSVYHLPFGVSASEISGTVQNADAGTHKNIVLTNSTPFQFAKDKNSIEHWYALNLHCNNKHYAYYKSDATPNVQANVTAYETAPEYAWGFVGNPFDGFIIYNKASEKALYSANNDTSCTVEEEGSTFKATLTGWSSAQADGGFCLNVEGQQYVNFQGEQLKHWGDNDAGSTFHAVEIDLSIKDFTFSFSGNPSEAKATYDGHDYTDGQGFSAISVDLSAITATKITGYLYTITLEGTNINVTYTKLPFTVDKVYTIMAKFADTGGTFYVVNGESNAVGQAELPTDGTGEWLYTEDGFFQNVATNKYLAANAGQKGLSVADNGHLFTYEAGIAEGTYKIYDSDFSYAVNKSGAIADGRYSDHTYVNTGNWTTDFVIEEVAGPAPMEIEYTINPAGGQVESDDLATITITVEGDIAEVIFPDETKMPTLSTENAAITASAFELVDYGVFNITFDTSEITDGTWTLTIPEGALYTIDQTLASVPVEEITATYTVEAATGYTLSIGSTGYSTIYLEENAVIPEGVTIYCVNPNDHGSMDAVEYEDNVLLGYAGYVVKGTENTEYTFTYTTDDPINVPECYDTLFGVAEETAIEGSWYEGYNIYVLSSVQGRIGFYKFAGESLKANRAFYVNWGATEINGFSLDFGGQTVGVNSVISATNLKAGYDIQGRKLNKVQKGINILNGKKIIK